MRFRTGNMVRWRRARRATFLYFLSGNRRELSIFLPWGARARKQSRRAQRGTIFDLFLKKHEKFGCSSLGVPRARKLLRHTRRGTFFKFFFKNRERFGFSSQGAPRDSFRSGWTPRGKHVALVPRTARVKFPVPPWEKGRDFDFFPRGSTCEKIMLSPRTAREIS